jgi:hypothetical protein
MDSHTYSVEFRIYSKTVDPHSITRDLGLQPCQLLIEGERRSATSVYKGMWAYNGTDDEAVQWDSLEEGLTFVLDKLWPHREAIAKCRANGDLIWWCGHFQAGFDGGPLLCSQLLRRLGEFGVDLFIDNYFSGEETLGDAPG